MHRIVTLIGDMSSRKSPQENCPACFEGPKERYRVKTLLAHQEHLFPRIMESLLRTMEPLMIDGSYAACVNEPPGSRPLGRYTKRNDNTSSSSIDAGDDV